MDAEVPKHETASTAYAWGPKSRIQALVLLVAIFGGIYICYLLALPFLSALTWALVPGGLVRLGSPGNRGQTEKVQPLSYDLGADGGADCRLPATFVVERSEAAKGAIVIQAQLEGGAWRRAIDAHPWVAPIDKWIEQQIDLPAIFGNVAS